MTYLEKSTAFLTEITAEEELKKTRDLTKAISNLTEATKIKVHYHLPRAPVSRQLIENIVPIEKLVHLAIGILAFIVIYYSSHFVLSLFSEKPPEYDFQGIPTVVMCEKCGLKEIKPIINIQESRCTKCHGQNWQAMHCYNCNCDFPFNENKYDDTNIKNPDKLNTIYLCPFCKSKNIEYLSSKKQESDKKK